MQWRRDTLRNLSVLVEVDCRFMKMNDFERNAANLKYHTYGIESLIREVLRSRLPTEDVTHAGKNGGPGHAVVNSLIY